MRTKIKLLDGHYETEIVREDGKKITLWFVGRCWKRVDDDGAYHEIPGREMDYERLLRNVRWHFSRAGRL